MDTKKPAINPKEWERMGDAYKSISVTVHLPKAIRDEMKYKDMIAFQLAVQAKARELLQQHIDEIVSKIEQMLEATLPDCRVEIEVRGI